LRKINIEQQDWPVAGSFRISRSALTVISTLRVTIEEDGFTGRGECRPYARYSEECESVSAQIRSIVPNLEASLSRAELQELMAPGAARNAVDCALWDLEAKMSGKSVSDLLGLPAPRPRETTFTLSMDTPKNMALSAKKAQGYPLLKIKVGSEHSVECALEILKARPDARLIIDANEGLTPAKTQDMLRQLEGHAIALIEQPLPHADFDHLPKQVMSAIHPPMIICADESLHTQSDLDALWDAGYRAVNVKLDKCGGLTEGLALMQAAKDKGFQIMAGCMVGSSLAMAPMMMLESLADFIDLDGPLLLADDIEDRIEYDPPLIMPPKKALWG